MKLVMIMFLLAYLPKVLAAGVNVQPSCDSRINQEIHACLERRRVASDELLNSEYKAAMSRLFDENRMGLRDVQRKWIRFRDAFCYSVRRENGDGVEASLEYTRCLYRLTVDRSIELRELGSSLSEEKFYSAIIALERIGIERKALIEKLALLDMDVVEWRHYVDAHCGLMGAIHDEALRSCKARMSFNRTYQ